MFFLTNSKSSSLCDSPLPHASEVKGLLEDLAAKHSGDMQTHLAFHRSRCQPRCGTAPQGGMGT